MLLAKASKGLAWSAAIALLGGCNLAGAGMLLSAPTTFEPAAQFTLERQGLPAPEGLLTPAPETLDFAPVRLVGRATVPSDLQGVANAQDGWVSGSPVAVYDATSGKVVSRSVTYYDGSFTATVPLRSGARAFIVAADLVSRVEPARSMKLMAPLLVTAGSAEQKLVLSPGTTALVAFLSALAQEQEGMSETTVALEGEGPGHVSAELSGLIAVFEPEVTEAFARLAEASPELRGAESYDGLVAGIQNYVGRLTRSSVKVGTAKP